MSTTLAAAVEIDDAIVTVADATGYPAAIVADETTHFLLTIGSEVVLVVDRSGVNCRVRRGVRGTTAAIHASGATVTYTVLPVSTTGTAAPSTGAWLRGDRCWNTTPSAAGVPGWVCTTAGSPGTWKAMAAVAA